MSKTKLFSAKMGKQISVFLENKPGTLSAVIDLLRENDVNMTALSLSEGLEHGYLRITVSEHEKAVKILQDKGNLVLERDVVLLEVANEPGGMASAIDRWAKAKINVEYAYSASGFSAERSIIVARVDDADKAIKVLDLP